MKHTNGLILLAFAGSATLTTDYSEERTLSIVTESSLTLETTSFELTRDGEPSDMGAGGGSDETRRVEYTDTWLAGDEDGPRHVRREFGEIEGEFEIAFGESSQSVERSSEWSDVTVELRVDEDDELEAEIVDGGEPQNSGLLELMQPTLFLDALLPEDGELEEGSTFELDSEQVAMGLGLTVDARLFAPLALGGGEGRGGGRRRRAGRQAGAGRILAAADWEGEGTVVSLDDELDGHTCARIEFTFEAEGDLEVPTNFRGRGRAPRDPAALQDAVQEATYALDLEGSLLFSLDEMRPMLLEVEGSVESTRHVESSFNGGSMVMDTEQEGEIEITVQVSTED